MKILSAEEARLTILKRRSTTDVELGPSARARTAAVMGKQLSAGEAVRKIIADVRAEGDVAVLRYSAAFDEAPYSGLEVPRAAIDAALSTLPESLRKALEFAAGRVRSFHEEQGRHVMASYTAGGLGVRVAPIETVGFYVPGTVAVYPSSVLHTVVPAKVAGVPNVYMISPAGWDGSVPAVKLAAAAIAGVDRVFAASGAQAIAALAYGTETVPKVDKICGPGNIFVTLAKRAVFGDVGIDSLYGPTETLIVGDESADPRLCAADMIAQAEHDEMATPIFLTDSRDLANRVAEEVERQLATLPRGSIARTAIESQGGAVVAKTIEEAVALASDFAPEHLCILSKDARRLSKLVKNAGGIFIGDSSPEAIGDYTAGPSHVMPTGGAARYASPLSLLDFLKLTSVIDLEEGEMFGLGPAAIEIATSEGLMGHARAVEERLPR